ncbi:Glucose-1-phosphate cytidylyltransferase [compost metagenome]
MDTVRDKMTLEELWASGRAPWKVWDDSERHAENTGHRQIATAQHAGGPRLERRNQMSNVGVR